ncbi:hypothetical protein CRENBAI_005175 [Crenichthys baileyi]|uniref:Transmembrane protein 81 n=1 Tax=Crenichthys baileyi TaxID=28760 RepID=A0AAV9SF98_9TELE
MRNLPKDLEVLPSPLLLEQMEREAVERRSPPAPLAAHSGPAVKSSPPSRRKKRRRGAPSCVSAGEESLTAAAIMPGVGTPLLAGGRAAASKPASLPATAPSPRLAAPPPMPSSLTPARCSEATPEELDKRLRSFARQIKTFRETSLMYSSPELMERIGQMERDYETAVRQFYCRPPSTPGLQGAAAAAEQPTPGLQPAVELSEGGLPPFPGPEHPFSFLWGVLTELKPDTHHDTPQSDTPQPDTPQPVSARPDTPQPVSARPDTPQPVSARPDPKSASTSSTRRRGRRKRDASVHATGGLCDASAPVHATEGLCDASAPVHATEGLCDASAPVHATEGPTDASAPSFQGFSGKLVLVLASEPCDEGFEEEEPPDPVSPDFKGQFVLVLASEPLDEGFEEEVPPDPVSGDFKEQFVLVLASEPRDEGSPGAASASEGLPGAASASEGSPGSASEGSPGTYRCDVQDTSYRRVKRAYWGVRVLPTEVVNLDYQSSLTQWELPESQQNLG